MARDILGHHSSQEQGTSVVVSDFQIGACVKEQVYIMFVHRFCAEEGCKAILIAPVRVHTKLYQLFDDPSVRTVVQHQMYQVIPFFVGDVPVFHMRL